MVLNNFYEVVILTPLINRVASFFNQKLLLSYGKFKHETTERFIEPFCALYLFHHHHHHHHHHHRHHHHRHHHHRHRHRHHHRRRRRLRRRHQVFFPRNRKLGLTLFFVTSSSLFLEVFVKTPM